MRSHFAVAALASLAAIAHAAPKAKQKPAAAISYVRAAAAHALLTPWQDCPELADLLAPPEGTELTARATPDGVEVLALDEGSGRWAYGMRTRLWLERGRCGVRGAIEEGPKEALHGGVRLLALGAAPRPTLAQLATLSGRVLVDDASTLDLAAARMLVQLAREDDTEPSDLEAAPGSLGPPTTPQPEHEGRPVGSPAALWSPAQLVAADVSGPWLFNEDGEAFQGIGHVAVRPPVLLAKRGQWELWELRFRARLGGGLLAVYDGKRDRHRWLWASSYDDGVRGKQRRFAVVVLRDELVVIDNVFDGRHHPWVFDLARGTGRQIAAGGASAVKATASGIELATEQGPRIVPFSALTP